MQGQGAEPEFPFAGTLGKSVLYKFRPYTSEEDRDRVRQILVDHKVYLARASQLNDPFDLYPRVQIASREALLDGLKKHLEKRPLLSEQQRQERIAYFNSADFDLEAHQRTVEERTRQRLEEGYWVFSLAGNRTHPMLWSHYAGGHSGLCVHFRADEGSLFSAAMAVAYRGERPVLPHNPSELPEHVVAELAVLRKGEFWSYEEEFRFIRMPYVDYSDFPIRFDGQHAFFDPRELCGVSVGARMPAREVGEVCELARAHVPRLPVWRARESRSAYLLEFDLIESPQEPAKAAGAPDPAPPREPCITNRPPPARAPSKRSRSARRPPRVVLRNVGQSG